MRRTRPRSWPSRVSPSRVFSCGTAHDMVHHGLRSLGSVPYRTCLQPTVHFPCQIRLQPSPTHAPKSTSPPPIKSGLQGRPSLLVCWRLGRCLHLIDCAQTQTTQHRLHIHTPCLTRWRLCGKQRLRYAPHVPARSVPSHATASLGGRCLKGRECVLCDTPSSIPTHQTGAAATTVPQNPH